jgi:ribonuclease P protein component
MRKEQRLRRRKDFAAAYRDGRTLGNQLLVLRVHRTGGEGTRWGFVAGKAVGGAVARNRVKRRLRAAADALEVRDGLDLIVSARRPAVEASYHELSGALNSLLKRAQVLEEAAGERAGRAQETP